MPITQIKYKITTKRALKPDTFKGYIKLKPKRWLIVKSVNSVSKIGHGFMCTEYDTDMCSWTSATNKERNLTIHHCNDL